MKKLLILLLLSAPAFGQKVNATYQLRGQTAADQIIGSTSSSAMGFLQLVNCASSTSALNYNTASHTFSCVTIAGGGTVASVSGGTANGFAVTVINGTTTPNVAVAFAPVAAQTYYGGPSTGTAAPTARALVGAGFGAPCTTPSTPIGSGNVIIGDSAGGCSDSGRPPTAPVQAGNIVIDQGTSSGFASKTMSGACTLTSTGVISCTSSPVTPVAMTGTTPSIAASTTGRYTETLTGNTVLTITGLFTGATAFFHICQPSSGSSYSFTFPAAFRSPPVIDSTMAINTCLNQRFVSLDGTTLTPESPGIIVSP